MINSNKLLALAASIVIVAEAIPVLPECVVPLGGSVSGTKTSTSTPFDNTTEWSMDTNEVVVGAKVA